LPLPSALPVVSDRKLSAITCRPFFANSNRITSFAHPHPLTPIESHLCKKTGGGVTLTKSRERRASCLCATRRNSRNSIPFIALLYNSRTPGVGGPVSPIIQVRAGQSQLTPRIRGYKRAGALGTPPHPSSVFPAPTPDAGYSMVVGLPTEGHHLPCRARFLGLSFEGNASSFYFSRPISEVTIRKVRVTAR
jgi:hypothetical protein